MSRIVLSISLLAALLLDSPISSHAAEVGQWETHAAFTAPPRKVIDTGKKIYYLSGYSLFGYDKKERESTAYTSDSGLNDPSITDIFYNDEKGFLLIAYSTGNIDLLYDNGRIINMSDISDSSIDPPLTINDVAFSGNRIYVATTFGLVEFDSDRHEVVQSGIYSTPVSAVAATDGRIVIYADGKLHSIPQGERFPALTRFNELYATPTAVRIIPAGDNRLLIQSSESSNTLSAHTIDFTTGTATDIRSIGSHTPGFNLSKAADGNFYFNADGAIYAIDSASLTERRALSLPEEFSGAHTATASGLDEIWSLTRDGLACHGFSSTGEPTLKMERYRPAQFSVREICYLTPSADGRRLYVTNNGSAVYRFDRPGIAGFHRTLTASRIDLATGQATDITPYPVDAFIPWAKNRQEQLGKYLLSPTGIAEDPDEPDVFYVSSSVDGIYKMRAGKLEGIYSYLNSPLFEFDGRDIAYHVSIDRGGNLWLVTTTAATDARPLFVLPAAKRRLSPDKVTPADWITLATPSVGYCGGQDIQTLHCRKSNITFITEHNTAQRLFAYDNRGTLSDFSDDCMKRWTSFTDQDGNIFTPTYCSALCEDSDGSVWIGTDQGVFVIQNPAAAVTDNMTVRRVKVPKNDGTNTAEYLLSTDLIYGISCDAAGRKWIATQASGLFLVSPDGSEILENFTEDNSPLPSKEIYSVYADPLGSTIYVGTPEGMYSYTTNTSPSMDDFSSITVFPNPVTPDYSGPIYIKGLMDGALVKITDSAGSLLYQGHAEGGMFTWSGCNSAGARVPSGIYFVFASEGPGDSSKGGTAKFMIIR